MDSAHVSAAEVAEWLQRLATGGDLGPLAAADSGAMCDLLNELELLKNATSAAQARVTMLAAERLRAQAIDGGTPETTADKAVAQQLALARRESPHAGSRHIGFARAMVGEMPAVHAALTAGFISEWTATQIVKETSCLSLEHRQQVDAHLAGRLGSESHRAIIAAAKAKAYELDPYSVVRRGRKAVGDRRVSVRPAPDVMAIVSGYVPVAQGVACYKALDEAAKAAKSAGDERSLDQIRADIFVERLTGQSVANDVSIEVGLVITDTALLGLDETPARLEGYGPIPAPLARDLIREQLDDEEGSAADQRPASDEQPGPEALLRKAMVWLRRLYADPATGVLTGQDDRRRLFTGPLRRFLVARDQVCRTPWCDAPVRHVDHVVPWARGGATTADGGEGMCEACNYAKEAAGWTHEVVNLPDGSHTVKITTPSGHTYYSQPPPILPTLGNRGTSLSEMGSSLPGTGNILNATGGSLSEMGSTPPETGGSLSEMGSTLRESGGTLSTIGSAAVTGRSAERKVRRASAMERVNRRPGEITLKLPAEEEPASDVAVSKSAEPVCAEPFVDHRRAEPTRWGQDCRPRDAQSAHPSPLERRLAHLLAEAA